MDLRPQYHRIAILKNDTLPISFAITHNQEPVDLSTADVKMQVRQSATSATVLLAFTEADGITVTNNIIKLNKKVTISAGNYVYDLEITYTNGEVRTYLYGDFIVTEDITK